MRIWTSKCHFGSLILSWLVFAICHSWGLTWDNANGLSIGFVVVFPPTLHQSSSLPNFIGFAYQGKDIVFRFIIVASWILAPSRSNFYMRIFERWYFGLCWNLIEIIYRVIIYLEGFWFLSEEIFWRLYFCMVKSYLSFHNSSFALRYVSM